MDDHKKHQSTIHDRIEKRKQKRKAYVRSRWRRVINMVIVANRFKIKPRHYDHKHDWKNAITRAKGVHMLYVGKDAAVTRRVNRRPAEGNDVDQVANNTGERRSLVDLEGEAAGWGVTRRGADDYDDASDEGAYYSDSDNEAGQSSRRESMKSNKSRTPSITPSSKRNSQNMGGSSSEKRSSFISSIASAIIGIASPGKRASMNNGTEAVLSTPSSKRSTMNTGTADATATSSTNNDMDPLTSPYTSTRAANSDKSIGEAPPPLEKRSSFLGNVMSMALGSGRDATDTGNTSATPEKRNSLFNAAMGISGKRNSAVASQGSSAIDQSKRSSFVGAVTKMFGGGSTEPVTRPAVVTKQVEVKPQPLRGKKDEENYTRKPAVNDTKHYDFEDVSSDDSDVPPKPTNPRANMRKIVSRKDITASSTAPVSPSSVQKATAKYTSNMSRDMFE